MLALAIAGAWGAAEARAQEFKILSLSETNVLATDRGGGDDRGGIGLSPTQVFNTGDGQTVRAPRDVSSTVVTGALYDGLVTDLSSETLYTLITSDGAYKADGDDVVTALERIDGQTGALTGERITLSQPFDSDADNSFQNFRLVCAGLGRAVVYNGEEVFDIAIPSGVVTNRGALAIPDIFSSENWASWGVAEFFDGQLHLAYRSNNSDSQGRDLIQRVRVSDGAPSTVAAFSELGDMAEFVVSPRTGRWFFHSENENFADPNDNFEETLAAADALSGTTVTNGNDSGPGSLRAAIESTNAVGGGTIIIDPTRTAFGFGVLLQSPLPPLAPGIIIDARLNSFGTSGLFIDGSNLGPGANGLVITGSNSRISAVELRNFAGTGIVVSGGTGSRLDRVRISGSSQAIDLNGDGPSANDALDEDGGANNTQNAPVLQSAPRGSRGAIVSGFLQSTPLTTFRLQLFGSFSRAATGPSQSPSFADEFSVTTDATGRAAFSFDARTDFANRLSATATGPDNSTSELSNTISIGGGRVSVGDVSIDENSGDATVQVLRDASGGPLSVRFATADGTAVASADYIATEGTLLFAEGEARKSISIPIVSENLSEGAESFSLVLSDDATGGTIADGTGAITIRDTSPVPAISLADATLDENASGAILATLSNPSSSPVSFTYTTQPGSALAPADFPIRSARLTFAPGQTSLSIPVAAQADALSEGDETFTVRASDAANASVAREATVTIRDANPIPALSLSDALIAEGDEGTTGGTITATLSGPSSRALSFDFATQNGTAVAPADYVARTGRITFEPGQLSQTITVAVAGDTLAENDEAFSLSATPVGAGLATVTRQSTITIRENDDASPLPSISLSDLSIVEGDSGLAEGVVTATLSRAFRRPVTFSFVTRAIAGNAGATADVDFPIRSGSITIAPGQTTAQIRVAAVGDGAFESDEVFALLLSDAQNATIAREATITIRNDDARPVVPPTPTPTPTPTPAPVTARELTILLPTNGAAYRVLPSVLGTYNGTLEVPVTVAIRNAAGQFWNGRAFAPIRTELPTARTSEQFVLLPQFAPPSSSLSEGPLQFIATARAGDQSATATSTVLIDRTAPRVAITSPAANATLSALAAITGTAVDVRPGTRSSGVARVLVAIRRGSDGAYWNGVAFQRAFFAADAQLSGARWALSRNLPSGANLRAGSYSIIAIAGDRAGNRAQATRSFIVASQPGA